MADKTVGLIATQMILMALLQRSHTGQGQSIEVPMFENMAAFVLSEHMYQRSYQPPIGLAGDPRLLDPMAKPLPTRDGYICVSANTDAQAYSLFDAIGRPELKSDPRFCSVAARFENVKEYFAIRAHALRERSTSEWLDIFERLDVPAMPYHTLDSLLDDPHLAEAGFFRERIHPSEGRIVEMAPPNAMPGAARDDWLPAPAIGQHSVEVLEEAGYSASEIATMVERRVTVDGRVGVSSRVANPVDSASR